MTCPPKHVEYLSQMLADNAIILHGFIHPDCPGVHRFPCGDHFHIGHNNPEDKAKCMGTAPPPARRMV